MNIYKNINIHIKETIKKMQKFTSDNLPDRTLESINSKLDKILLLEQKELQYYKKQEKYQVYKKDKSEKIEENKKIEESKRYAKYNKDLKKSGSFVENLIGWLTKMGTLIISYKVAEWVSDPKNSKKVGSLLKMFGDITRFIIDFTKGTYGFLEGTIKNLDAIGKKFNEFFDTTIKGIETISNPIGLASKAIKSIPKIVESGINSVNKGVSDNLESSSKNAVIEANKAIDEGVKSLAEPSKESNQKTQENDVVSATNTVTATPEVAPNNLKKIDETKKPDTKTEELPKLAKGGLVSKRPIQQNNIKPLSSLMSGTTNNQKFNNEVKSISPKFEELMKLPFTVIGSGIVSILKSAIKDNPDSNNTISPLINSIGKLFNVPVGETENNLNLKVSENTENNLSTNTGKPPVIKTGNYEGKYQRSNDNSVTGLLADILNALVSKSPNKKPFEQRSSGGNVEDVGSGWIKGSHEGFPVSLDGGESTSFIGHGTEYVAKHKSNNNSFVIPFDTPATKSNKNLTKTRINQAMAGGYELPKMADGGLVTPNGWNDGIRLEELNTKNGKMYYKVAAPLAKRFKGFVDELETSGYTIKNIGGYNPREKEEKNIKLGHPFGAAIDINPDKNPLVTGTKKNPPKLITDMPKNISSMAKKYGLGWGGNWKSKKDAMHFSAMKREGGAGFDNKEIIKGSLTEKKPQPLKKMASGGMVESNGFNNGIKLEEFTTKNGKMYYKVAAPLAKRFKGFVDELESTGYKIKNIGGYNPRKGEDNGQGKYAHPYGAAIDINYNENPYGSKLITDMPSNITQMAKKYGLGWGGNWKSKKDAMHFSAMKREGGDGFNGKEIARGILSGGVTDNFKQDPNSKDIADNNNNTKEPTPEAQPIEPTPPDFGKIGSAFTQLTQMLGLGGSDEEKRKKINKIVPNTSPKSPLNPVIPNKKENITNPSSVPTPLPSPTKIPYKKDHLTASNPVSKPKTHVLAKSGTTNNVKSKNSYTATGFNFTSDTHKFTALSSTSGNVLESIFV